MKHTPGPWKVHNHSNPITGNTLCIHSPKSKKNNSNVITFFKAVDSEDRANARLIAESPKMYEVCKYLAENGWNAGVTEMAREVIARVEEPK